MGQEFLEVSVPSSYDALEAERLPVAVDGALQKMERQLKKLHDKRRKPRPDIVPQVMADSTD